MLLKLLEQSSIIKQQTLSANKNACKTGKLVERQ